MEEIKFSPFFIQFTTVFICLCIIGAIFLIVRDSLKNKKKKVWNHPYLKTKRRFSFIKNENKVFKKIKNRKSIFVRTGSRQQKTRKLKG